MRERLEKYIAHYEAAFNKATAEGRNEDAIILLKTYYFYVDELTALRTA